MPEKSTSDRMADCEKIEADLQTELVSHADRLRELEADTKSLVEFVDFSTLDWFAGNPARSHPSKRSRT